MASIEGEQPAYLLRVDLVVKSDSQNGSQIDRSKAAKEKQRPLSDEVPWRVTDAEKYGMFMRRSIRPW